MRILDWLAEKACGRRREPTLLERLDEAVKNGEVNVSTVEELEEERNVIELQLVRDFGVVAGHVPLAVSRGILNAHHPLVERWIEIDSLLQAVQECESSTSE